MVYAFFDAKFYFTHQKGQICAFAILHLTYGGAHLNSPCYHPHPHPYYHPHPHPHPILVIARTIIVMNYGVIFMFVLQ